MGTIPTLSNLTLFGIKTYYKWVDVIQDDKVIKTIYYEAHSQEGLAQAEAEAEAYILDICQNGTN